MQKHANRVKLKIELFYPGCCKLTKDVESILELHVDFVKILYIQEVTFRIIDYFMDKFIWALTWSDPYLDIEIKKKKERIHQDIDDSGLLEKINELLVERIELH